MKKNLIILGFVFLLAAGCQSASVKPSPVACTQEAKLCEDGSSVSRSGPNCEFAACPVASTPPPNPSPIVPTPAPPIYSGSGITGIITIGPSCPVERIPPDPGCADKPYVASFKVVTQDGNSLNEVTSGKDGKFRVSLEPGVYTLIPQNSPVYPRAGSQTVTVVKNQFTQVSIMYDSGIR